MLELHVEYPAPHFPSLVDLAPTLHKWRKGANERGIDFFAFTLIRKPIPHALSFFNFFHVGHNDFRPPPSAKDHDHWNAFKPLSSSESNFLQSYFVRNRQCRMYDSDPTATLYATKDLVWKRTSKEKEQHHQQNKNDSCRFDMVHNTLFEVLDWVGTTEQMQNLTLPLLTKIVANNPFLGLKNEPFKVFDKGGKKGMKVDDLSENTLTQISERTKLDQILYDDVVQTFTLQNLGWDFKSRGWKRDGENDGHVPCFKIFRAWLIQCLYYSITKWNELEQNTFTNKKHSRVYYTRWCSGAVLLWGY